MRILFLFLRIIIKKAQKALLRESQCFRRLLGCWIYDGASFALLNYILNRYRSLAGWDANQVIFLYAFHLFTYSVSAAFCRGLCASLRQNIETGELDQAFLQPVSPLVYAALQGIRVKHLSRTPVALFAMCYAYSQMNIAVSPISIVLLLIMLISALFAQSALWIAASCFCFLWKGKNVFAASIDVLSVFARFPFGMYGPLPQMFLTFLLPLGFAGYFPASVIVGATTDFVFSRFLPLATPMAGLLLLTGSIFLWRWLHKRYTA